MSPQRPVCDAPGGLEGGDMLHLLLDALRLAGPLVHHFAIRFPVSVATDRLIARDHSRTTAIAAVIGPLVEVRVRMLSVGVALRPGSRWFSLDAALQDRTTKGHATGMKGSRNPRSVFDIGSCAPPASCADAGSDHKILSGDCLVSARPKFMPLQEKRHVGTDRDRL